MTANAVPRDRPVAIGDIRQKLSEIRSVTESGAETAKQSSVAVAVAVVAVVVVVAFVLGNRRGKKRRTIVEVRRI